MTEPEENKLMAYSALVALVIVLSMVAVGLFTYKLFSNEKTTNTNQSRISLLQELQAP
jgi:hypothetical protein